MYKLIININSVRLPKNVNKKPIPEFIFYNNEEFHYNFILLSHIFPFEEKVSKISPSLLYHYRNEINIQAS